MTSRKYLPRKYWEQKLREWSASGESARHWCDRHQITYNTFIKWKMRLTMLVDDKSLQATQNKDTIPPTDTPGFVELVDEAATSPGIYLECGGVKIHLSSSFDPVVLKRCLSVMRGGGC